MSIVKLGAISVNESSYNRARKIVESRPEGARKTANEVLESLRQMMPGWNITTSTADWGEGFRNIEIDLATLNRMAEDPELMVKYKALILDLEYAVPELEQWAEENSNMSLQFGIMFSEDGTRAMARIRTLLGAGANTTFELPTDRPAWSEVIRQKLEALVNGGLEDSGGSKSWVV